MIWQKGMAFQFSARNSVKWSRRLIIIKVKLRARAQLKGLIGLKTVKKVIEAVNKMGVLAGRW